MSVARVFNHTQINSVVCLDVEVSPNMPRTKSKAVSEGNSPVPQDKFGSGKLTMAEQCRVSKEVFNRTKRHLEELTGEMRKTNQRLARLQLQAWQ